MRGIGGAIDNISPSPMSFSLLYSSFVGAGRGAKEAKEAKPIL